MTTEAIEHPCLQSSDDAEVLQTVTKMLEAAIPEMRDESLPQLFDECSIKNREWLESNSLHWPGTTECYAWHAGYVAAMSDILQMLKRRRTECPQSDDTV